jgi:hypothetical protein
MFCCRRIERMSDNVQVPGNRDNSINIMNSTEMKSKDMNSKRNRAKLAKWKQIRPADDSEKLIEFVAESLKPDLRRVEVRRVVQSRVGENQCEGSEMPTLNSE